MKKYISIIDAAVNSTFSKIMITLALLACTELGYFILRLLLLQNYRDFDGFPYSFYFLDHISGPVIPGILFIAFGAITLAQLRILNLKKIRTWYTIRRLGIPEKDFYLTLTGYFFLVYVLLVLVQILLYMAMFFLYRCFAGPEAVGGADLFLVFVMNPFAGHLLPLGQPLWFFAEFMLVLAASCCLTLASMIASHSDSHKPDVNLICWVMAVIWLPVLYFESLGKSKLTIVTAVLSSLLLIVISIHEVCTFQRKESQ